MNPTSDSRIRETNWFVVSSQPFMEFKIYSATVGNLIYYITARRGISDNLIPAFKAMEHPVAVTVSNAAEITDNSLEQFNKLRQMLDKPAA